MSMDPCGFMNLLVIADATHSAGDEVKDPARNIPLSMVLSVVINGGFQIGFVILLLFTLGDPATTLETPTGYPIIQILYGATKSHAGTTVLMVMLFWNGLVAIFSSLASVSRLTWAFARDKGLPFSNFFGYVSFHFWTTVQLQKWALTLYASGVSKYARPAKCAGTRDRCHRFADVDQPRL